MSLSCAVLTISDTRTRQDDKSGNWLCEQIPDAGHTLADRAIVKDDIYAIRTKVSTWIAAEDIHRCYSLGKKQIEVLRGIDLEIAKGETVGIVGESGSGKTSLGRCLVRLHEPTSGKLLFDGKDITLSDARELRPLRSRLQMIFQDPQSSLNPRE